MSWSKKYITPCITSVRHVLKGACFDPLSLIWSRSVLLGGEFAQQLPDGAACEHQGWWRSINTGSTSQDPSCLLGQRSSHRNLCWGIGSDHTSQSPVSNCVSINSLHNRSHSREITHNIISHKTQQRALHKKTSHALKETPRSLHLWLKIK